MQTRLPGLPSLLWIFLAAGLHPALPASAPQPAGWTVFYQDDFESGNANGWAITLGDYEAASWGIEMDGTNHVLGMHGMVTATLTLGRWSDYRYAANIKLIQGAVNLCYRQGLNSGYVVTFQQDQSYIGRPTSGTPGSLAHAAGIGLNTWYTVEIVGVGAEIKVYLNGSLTMDYTDPNPILNGGVAVQGQTGGYFLLDNVELSGPPAPVQPTWVKTGGPLGGVGYDIRMRPDNFNVLYVTDTNAGVNVSVDGGNTWSETNTGITARAGLSGDAIPVFCLTIDPHNPNIVWAGTQGTRGIFKSLDGGNTWTEKDNGITDPLGSTLRGFTVDPRTSDVVYAAGEIPGSDDPTQTYGLSFTLAKGVVYKTTDGGANWTAIWRGDAVARYIWIDPANPNTLYVSTGFIDREPMNSNAATLTPGGVGVLKSQDAGQTWQVLNGANGLANLYVTSLMMHPQNPNILLAGTGSLSYKWSNTAGVYLTTDGGNHWTQTLTATLREPGVWDPISTVKFAAANPQIAYAASQTTFWRSQDGGQTWRIMAGGPGILYYGPPGVYIGQCIDLQIDPRNPDRAFLDNYGGGVFLTEDGGATWTVSSRGYTGAQMFDVKVDPTDPLRIYTTGQPGIYGSRDGGASWDGYNSSVTANDPLIGVAIDPSNPQHIILTDDCCGRLVRTLDGGNTWTQNYQYPAFLPGGPILTVNQTDGFKAIAFAPSNPKVLYLGMRRSRFSVDSGYNGSSYGVLKSIDGGETVQDANDGNTAHQDISTLAIDPATENTVYVGTLFAGVFQTRDGGHSWRAMNQGLSLLDVRALAIDPSNSSTLYAGIENGGVYKTVNAGGSWSYAGYGMDPQAVVRSIAIDPTNPLTIYAADVRSGVYTSTDGAKTWTLINAGLRIRAVNVLSLSSDGSTLYAATDAEGVYRLDVGPRAETAVSAVSAATFIAGAALAPESIASLFGQGLAAATAVANSAALPSALSDASVVITGSDGIDRTAPLFFVSPGQINCLIPAGMPSGPADVRVFRTGRVAARGQLQVASVAPGLFTANGDGKGVPAAVAIKVASDGTQTVESVYQCGATSGSCTAAAIDLGSQTDQVILLLFGTGIRGASSAAAVKVQVGGMDALVLGEAPQGQFAGLDQVNVLLPGALRGHGDVNVALVVDGNAANIVTIRIL
jgi:uncharacterized protein (TIGR03437 family)